MKKTIIFTITLLTICITGCGKKYDESPLSLAEGYNAIISEAKADGREEEIYEMQNAIQSEYEADMKKRAEEEAEVEAQKQDPHPEWLVDTTEVHIGTIEENGIGYGVVAPVPRKLIEYRENLLKGVGREIYSEDVLPGYKSFANLDGASINSNGVHSINVKSEHDGYFDHHNESGRAVKDFADDDVFGIFSETDHVDRAKSTVIRKDGFIYVFQREDAVVDEKYGVSKTLKFYIILPGDETDTYYVHAIGGRVSINTLYDVKDAADYAEEYVQLFQKELKIVEGADVEAAKNLR